MCDAGAPEAAALSRLGVREGSPNTHPGQGTANRRYFFQNAYLELLWVQDAAEAQREPVRHTRLWDRWLRRQAGACPFGVVLRAGSDTPFTPAPFPTWAYVPHYLPQGTIIDVGSETPLTEPEFFYMGLLRAGSRPGQEPVVHDVPLTQLTGVAIGMPGSAPLSATARAIEARGLIAFDRSIDFVLRLIFDNAIGGCSADLRPALPLVLEW